MSNQKLSFSLRLYQHHGLVVVVLLCCSFSPFSFSFLGFYLFHTWLIGSNGHSRSIQKTLSKPPDPPVLLENHNTPIPIPVLQDIPYHSTQILLHLHILILLTPEWIDNMCKYVGNCLYQQPELAVS